MTDHGDHFTQFNNASLGQTQRAFSLFEAFYFHSRTARDIADKLLERADREGRFEEMVEKIAERLEAAHDISEEHRQGLAKARAFDEKCGPSQALRKASLRSGTILEDNTLENDSLATDGMSADAAGEVKQTFKPTFH